MGAAAAWRVDSVAPVTVRLAALGMRCGGPAPVWVPTEGLVWRMNVGALTGGVRGK